MRKITTVLGIATILAALGAAVSWADVTTFDNGTEGWSVSGRDDIVLTGGNPGANMDVILIDVFGADIRNTTNPAFQGDYTALGPFTLTVDIRTDSITFGTQQVSRELIVELRDNTPSSAGFPYVSVWASLGELRANPGQNSWQTYSINVMDPTATELPPGWGGIGDEDPVTFEPILPADRTFADVLASVDELHFTTFVPGFAFGFTNFEMAVDNVGFTSIDSPADSVTFVETYEDGMNHGMWSWGTGNEQIVTTGGNPGAHLQDLTLSTFTPGAATAPGYFSQFVGNFRGRGVSSVGIDLRIFDVSFPVDPSSRPLTLILHNDNGTPQNFEDDWGAWFIGNDPIPTPGGGLPGLAPGWNSYEFDVPSGELEMPDGWTFFDCTDQTTDCVFTDAPNQPTGPNDWLDLMANVDMTEFFYGVPGTIGILNGWDVGLDNPRITSLQLAGDLDGDGEVGTSDIRLLPAAFGPCSGACPEDLNGDGVVDNVDMRLLISLIVPRLNVRFRSDRETLTWNELSRASFYEVRRGQITDLSDLDGDGLSDDGYGSCIGTHVPTGRFVDTEVPAPGTGFYYLVGFETATGSRDVGYTSAGGVRADSGGCP